jgi:hypothetical protein
VVMGLSLLKPDLKPIAYYKIPAVCWFGTGGLILLSALRFNVDWVSDGLMFLVVCPLLFFFWGNADYRQVMKLLSRACVISFGIYLVPSMLMIPIEEQQYAGLFNNVNGTALYLIAVFACLLVEALCPRKKSWYGLIYLLLLGICFALIFYTNSRTGQLAAILCFLLVGGVALVREKKANRKNTAFRLLAIVLAVGGMLPLTVYLFHGGNLLGQAMFAASPSQSGVSGLNTFLEYNNVKMEMATQGVETMSTGRVNIWKAYLSHSHFFGNGMTERFWIDGREAFYSTAHMTFITFAFRHGYFCGLLFAGFVACSAWLSVRFALRRKESPWSLLPLAVTIVYFVATMLASINTPFYYIVTVYYYLVQAPLLIKSEKGQNQNEKIIS